MRCRPLAARVLRAFLRRVWPLAALAYLLIVAVVYAPVFFLDRSLQPPLLYPLGAAESGPSGYAGRTPVNIFNLDLADPAYNMWPTNKLVGDIIASGEVPLWNPHQGGGHPLAAQYSTRAFFPYQVLENLSPVWSWDFYLLGRLWIAAFLTFLLLRRLGASPLAAFFGGTCFMLSGTFGWFIWLEQVLNVAMLLPLLLLGVDMTAREAGGRGAALTALATGLVLLGGQPEVALYVLTFGAAFFIYRLLERGGGGFVSAALLYAAGSGLGVSLAAPLLLPFLEHVGISFHLHPAGGDMGVRDPTPWSWLSAIIFPTLYSLPRPPTYTPLNGLWDHVGGYVGVLPLIVAGFGVRRAAPPIRRLILFFLAAGAFIILKHAGIPPFLWLGHLPIFDQVWSQRYGSPVWTFSLALAAGLGAHALWAGQPRAAAGHPAAPAAADANGWRRAGAHLAAVLPGPPLFVALVAAEWIGRPARRLAAMPVGLTNFWRRLAAQNPTVMGIGGAAVVALLALAAATLPVLSPEAGLPVGPASTTMLLIPIAGLGVMFATRPAGTARMLADPWCLVTIAISLAVAALALATYPLIQEPQIPFFAPVVLLGIGVSLTTVVVGLWLVCRGDLGRATLLGLVALAVDELCFVLPRGYPPAWEAVKVLAWAFGLAGVVAVAQGRNALAGLAAMVALATYLAVDATADRGYPDRADPFARPAYAEFLAGSEGRYRVMGGGGVLMPNLASAWGLDDVHYIQVATERHQHEFVQRHLQEMPLLRGNSLWFTGIPVRQPRNLAPALTLWYRDFAADMNAVEYSLQLAVERLKHTVWAKHQAYGQLSVRFIVLPRWAELNPPPTTAAARHLPDFPLVYDGEVRIFENPSALPRTYIVHAVERAADAAAARERATRPDFEAAARAIVETALPRFDGAAAKGTRTASAEIVEYGANRVEIEAETSRPGLLILSDVFYPGWTAEVDGRPVEIERVNGLLRGVWLAPGRHQVRFAYNPASFRIGLAIGLAGALGIAALLWPRRRRRR